MSEVVADKNLIEEALTRAVQQVYPSRETLEKELMSGRRLRIYLGVDPTGPHLHLGHLTNLLVLKRFQDLGHEVIFLIGDFTALIGDPTDKLSPRQPLTPEEIKENLKTFKKQAGRILKFSGENRVQVKFNSKWLAKMNFEALAKLFSHFTVQQLIQRDMFQERLKENKPISAQEFLYPLMQGYDSVAMDVDIEIGGTDQTFNMLVGRDLMKIYKNKEKFVLTTKLLENPKTGGKLMNKSEGGLINLDDEPNDIFGKVMALDDNAIVPVAEFSTEMPLNEIETLKAESESNPREAKLKVAKTVVKTIYSEKKAIKAGKNFVKVFSEKQKPEDIKAVKLNLQRLPLVDLLVQTNLALSKSEARRLIEQGGVKIDDVKKTDPQETISLAEEILIQVGPRRFLKVTS
ncbi:MAG TPA: tyrosine--tRNA ligase [Candidatus Paceibacterota bacterium]